MACWRRGPWTWTRIVSRTLAYSALTVLLGGGYAVVVLGFGQLLGQDSSLVAGATLTLAAVFQPARRRVQQVVDRRFNRRRYDAAMTIAAFSARLRQQVDLQALTAELLAVVDQTMQPTQASLWLRATRHDPARRTEPHSAPSPAASSPRGAGSRRGGQARRDPLWRHVAAGRMLAWGSGHGSRSPRQPLPQALWSLAGTRSGSPDSSRRVVAIAINHLRPLSSDALIDLA